MIAEMTALHDNGTWELVALPQGKTIVGCRWVSTVKVVLDGVIARLKARLVAKGYTASIMEILPHQLPRWLLSVFSSLWQQ